MKSMQEINEDLGREDYNYNIISSLYSDVTRHRGWGDSGREIQIVEKECDLCGYDRQIQTIRVSPERRDEFEYECQNPNCPNFHDGRVGYRR